MRERDNVQQALAEQDGYRCNRYRDLIIDDAHTFPHETHAFGAWLSSHIPEWQRRGHSAVWLRLPNRLSHLLPVLFEFSFRAHHTGSNYIQCTLWLRRDTPDRLPAFGTHVARVELVCYDVRRDSCVLVIERYSRFTDDWRLPSGSVEIGEFISGTAVREMREELGLDVKFEGILGIANRILVKFQRSEVAVACLVTPIDPDAPLQIQRDELDDARWVTVTEALQVARRRNAGVLTASWLGKIAAAERNMVRLRASLLSMTRLRDFRGGEGEMMIYN